MKLIDRDALVAEIKERIETYNKGYANGDDKRADTLDILLHDLNNFEVKEVDLEKEIEFYWLKRCDLTWCKDIYSATHIREMFSNIARHFFELGMQQSNNDNNNEEKS